MRLAGQVQQMFYFPMILVGLGIWRVVVLFEWDCRSTSLFTKHIQFTSILFHEVHHVFYQSWISILALQWIILKACHLQHDVRNLRARTVLNRVCMIHEQSAYLFRLFVCREELRRYGQEIWSTHIGKYDDYGAVGCDVKLLVGLVPLFLSPEDQALSSCETVVPTYQTAESVYLMLFIPMCYWIPNNKNCSV